MKCIFQRTINWKKYQSIQALNKYLDYLIDPSFQGGNRTVRTKYYLPTVEIKDYNVMIDGQNYFDQPVKNNSRTYYNIQKTVTSQRDDYTTSCLLDYNYFNKYQKMTAIYLIKQQALDAGRKAIRQINFTGNLKRGKNVNENTTMSFIIQEAKETILDFSQETVKVF